MQQNDQNSSTDLSLAIIGMAGRFPGASDVAELWQMISTGRKARRRHSDSELLAAGIPADLVNNPDYVKVSMMMDDIDRFDAAFFGFSPRDAETMDPQSRIFLQTVWHALEDAGYAPADYKQPIGMFAGKHPSSYHLFNINSNPELLELTTLLQLASGNDADALASMASYKLDLKGPSINVQTFCSTSMVAVHLACQSLLAYECDIALAGGAAIEVPHGVGYLYDEGSILSPDGECRTFDKDANGSVYGSGVAAVALKRLDDAVADGDNIYAVIRGSATNNDGILRVGYTAPGVNGQATVILEALGNSGIDPETIGYIEAHGTATPLGDSIELESMIQAYDMVTEKQQFCAIGSIKPNIGHLDRASGVTGLIKTALMLQQRKLLPSLNFNEPSEDIDLANSPFYVNTELCDWAEPAGHPRRAGVSSFGLGGTNVHVVLEEAPPQPKPASSRRYQLIPFSAKTDASLERMSSNLTDHLQASEQPLADIAYTLQVGRESFNHRRTVVGASSKNIADALALANPKRVTTTQHSFRDRPVTFMLPGVGDHYVGVGQGLYQSEATFRHWVDSCSKLLEPLLGCDLRDKFLPERDVVEPPVTLAGIKPNLRQMLTQEGNDHPLAATTIAQPLMFVVEYALAQLLMEWGIRPNALIGYSLGEYTAACLAGVLSLEDALTLVSKRAQLIETLESGSMLTVAMSEADLTPLLNDALSLAGVLTPNACVVSGQTAAIEALEAQLMADEVICRRLPTTHAFHSSMMLPIADAFREAVASIKFSAPTIPVVSNLTGTWLTAEDVANPDYWVHHMCETVRFSSSLEALLAEEPAFLLEVGPGNALGSFARQHPACSAEQRQGVAATLPTAFDETPADAFLLQTIGQLWANGVTVDWAGFYGEEERQRVSLPKYPFARRRFWVEARGAGRYGALPTGVIDDADDVSAETSLRDPDITNWFYSSEWEATNLPKAVKLLGDWLIFCDSHGIGEGIATEVEKAGGSVIRVTAGKHYAATEKHFTLDPQRAIDYFNMMRSLKEQGRVPQKIAHLWNLESFEHEEVGADRFHADQQYGFYSLINVTQSISAQNISTPLDVLVITSNSHVVNSEQTLAPEKSTIYGAVRAIVQEEATINCRAVDIDLADIDDKTAQLISAEFGLYDAPIEVAYRDGKRFERQFAKLPIEKHETSKLRQNGTYLITGGLGGVGLLLAKYLARSYSANLILLGHSPLPEREEWDAWLETHPVDDRTAHRIRKIRDIEEQGGTVSFVQADVADAEKMAALWAEGEQRFGRIDGVLHAAGISDGKAFDAVSRIRQRQCEYHFQPKVYGLYVLADLLAERDLDFCLVFSSVSSVLGGLGFVGYTAANNFMDIFTHQYNRTARTKWVSVCWDTWRTVANQHDVIGRTVAEFEMSPAEGAEAFERIIASEIEPQVIESTGDLDARIRQWILLESLQNDGDDDDDGAASERPELAIAYQPASGDYEQKIASVWQKLLGIDKIGIHDNFFDLGGNSLVGLQVIGRLKKELDMPIPVVALFEAPTISSLAKYLQPSEAEAEPDEQQITLSERRQNARQDVGEQRIAIIGMTGRFPGANNVKDFWKNLCEGVESITWFTDEELEASGVPASEYESDNYIKARPIIDDPGMFDATFFGFNPREAELTDPQHRLFLECSWEVLEKAGYDPLTYAGRIGIYGGSNVSAYIRRLMADSTFMASLGDYETTYQLAIGNDTDSLATTVSYKLNLTGPSLSVQTFCSTSLVSTHLACQSLISGESDMALAGGVSIRVPIKSGHTYFEGGMESPDGHCRTFDAKADGTLFGDGVSMVALKRLEDALEDGDVIHGVIVGSAVNNDGLVKVGYTAPGVEGQVEAVSMALENAGVSAESIGYIEAHGTATALGDPIEVTALTRAFRRSTDKVGYCPIGSLKTNVGHLDRASGVAGLIKSTLAVKHGVIPPTLHYEEPNPEIDFANSPFYVNAKLAEWESNGTPRRAGVSSLGMGGTNAHVIVEEPPNSLATTPSRSKQLLLLSARTETALENATQNLTQYLRENPDADLADVAYTYHVGRHAFESRRMVVCDDVPDAIRLLESADPRRVLSHYQKPINRSVTFMFPGVGDHYLEMGRELFDGEAIFRAAIEECSQLLYPYLGREVEEILYSGEVLTAASQNGSSENNSLRAMLNRNGSGKQLNGSAETSELMETSIAQPIVFVVEYALARLLMSWGIRPQAMVGYSLGEYVAACLSGVLSLEDALYLVAERARLIGELPQGSMMVVSSSLEDMGRWLSDDVSLAAHNGKKTCLVAGETEVLNALFAKLEAEGIAARILDTTHAFHSHMMAGAVEQVSALVENVTMNPPRIPYISNVTGTWITADDVADPSYWVRHMCGTVRFFEGLNELLTDEEMLLLEVGPGQALGSFVKQHPFCGREQIGLVLPTMRYGHERGTDLAFLLQSIGRLWLLGVAPHWEKYYQEEKRQRLVLPTYPFDYQRFWLDGSPDAARGGDDGEPNEFEEWFYIPAWNQTIARTPSWEGLPEDVSWLVFSDEDGVGQQIVEQLRANGQTVVTVSEGDAFAQDGEHFTVRAKETSDYVKLIQTMAKPPTHIVHSWCALDEPAEGDGALESTLDRGLFSLITLARALSDCSVSSYQLSVVATHIFPVIDGEPVVAAHAAVIGPCKVIPQEYPEVNCRLIEIAAQGETGWQSDVRDQNLLSELLSADFQDLTVALRGKRRLAQTFDPVTLPADLSPGLRQNGVYLITGGLGGIGLAMAEYLAEHVQARLVLLGRTPMPPRDEWTAIANKEGVERGTGRKIDRIRYLERMGSEVLTVAADVSNREQLQKAIELAGEQFGKINGVVHAAGLPGMGMMQVKTFETVAEVLAPKIAGTLLLDELLQDHDLDFYALFSSISALMGGGPGQVDYAAANAFQDTYAYQFIDQPRRVISYAWNEWQWNAWAEGLEGFGAEVQEQFAANRLKYGISFPKGQEAFGRILAAGVPHVVISPAEFNQIVEESKTFTIEKILEMGRQQRASRPKYARPALGTSYVAPSTDTERKIAEVWEEMLGIENIGVFDNFFDLGGNSLIGIDLVSRLKEHLEVERIPAHVIYEAPSISELAKYLSEDHEEKKMTFAERLERGAKRRNRVRQYARN